MDKMHEIFRKDIPMLLAIRYTQYYNLPLANDGLCKVKLASLMEYALQICSDPLSVYNILLEG